MCPVKPIGSPRESEYSDVKATPSRKQSDSRSLVITRAQLVNLTNGVAGAPYVIECRVEQGE